MARRIQPAKLRQIVVDTYQQCARVRDDGSEAAALAFDAVSAANVGRWHEAARLARKAVDTERSTNDPGVVLQWPPLLAVCEQCEITIDATPPSC